MGERVRERWVRGEMGEGGIERDWVREGWVRGRDEGERRGRERVGETQGK